ncbi:lysylphosphatidylglycerol synthase transmembrane domain-containing protein [Roseivirga sp.]|uniref:lysylphosphatidylglycerol synthase transmembrane domain-containing protein n=1 Tax=Roseivirga sp. TaxID=1964215 RepID=UPI003B8BB3F1
MDKRVKKGLKLTLQIAIAAFAIYYVVDEIDVEELKSSLLKANIGWLLLALLAFNASKILSAIRLNHFFKAIEIRLSEIYNLKLYYLGMLYNQFLPGGIGGDGYKVYLLNKIYKKPVKQLLAATLLDRISGVVALGFLGCGLGLLGTAYDALEGYGFLLWLGLVLAFPAYYVMVHYIFPTYKKVSHITNIQAIGVQSLQVLCAFLILKSLGVETGYVDYFTLFLLSSVLAALPISLPGGFGVRELTMTIGYEIFLLNESASVALASLFFLITLVSSLIGIAYLKIGKVETIPDATTPKQ